MSQVYCSYPVSRLILNEQASKLTSAIGLVNVGRVAEASRHSRRLCGGAVTFNVALSLRAFHFQRATAASAQPLIFKNGVERVGSQSAAGLVSSNCSGRFSFLKGKQ